MTRREFLLSTGAAGGACAVVPQVAVAATPALPAATEWQAPRAKVPSRRLDLSPARWLWYPSGRCLPSTFILFRRAVTLSAKPVKATGWIAADSRYRLEVNGERVQWGPAPHDPRWPEADPLDLTQLLHEGENVLGATVLFYGAGDGTWPVGKPGFLFKLELEMANGERQTVVSDDSWRCLLAKAWQPGHYKRWYLRALQEEFDARQYPYDWSKPGFSVSGDWLPAMVLEGGADKPALATNFYEYMLDIGSQNADAELRPRSIPMLRENWVPVAKLSEQHAIEWLRPPEDYFAMRVPNAFKAKRQEVARATDPGAWEVALTPGESAGLTFEFTDHVVGWPAFTLEAPAGTVVELLVHEAHAPSGPAVLNTHFESWTRFTCREGVNRFETFDFESLRWLQLLIRGEAGKVVVREVGVRRRQFPWPNEPALRTSEPALQRLFEASFNTLHNCAQETLVDGMARERQQYSGDCGHQTHAIYFGFGEKRLPARYLATFSQGLTLDGYFLDCWPAYDRLARLMERQLQLTGWGPILDHGIGFNFDCWHHYLYTGDLEALREPFPRLLRFAQYLRSIVTAEGVLPVENLGIPSVWIDHNAYQKQAHKQCAFTLYAAAMLRHALAPICEAMGETVAARAASQFGEALLEAAQQRFWDPERRVFVVNRPWLAEEKRARLCDRSLATAVLFDQCPDGQTAEAVAALAGCPPEMGFSYPANAGWRLWALGKGGRADVIVQDLRQRWATMGSVVQNKVLQEDWEARTDSSQQWSHCAVVPIYIAHMGLAGLRPLTPGCGRVELRPQLASLPSLDFTAHTPHGPIRFAAQGTLGDRRVEITLPAGCEGELVLKREETVTLEKLSGTAPTGHARYRLAAGKTHALALKHA